jgi:radical SAM protein with 4Fe4S-binding SPASM domain
MHDEICHLPWSEVFITPDGNVYFCCHNKFPLGNLCDYNSFMELWNNEIAISVRNSIKNKELHPMCDSPSCPFKGVFVEGDVEKLYA